MFTKGGYWLLEPYDIACISVVQRRSHEFTEHRNGNDNEIQDSFQRSQCRRLVILIRIYDSRVEPETPNGKRSFLALAPASPKGDKSEKTGTQEKCGARLGNRSEVERQRCETAQASVPQATLESDRCN